MKLCFLPRHTQILAIEVACSNGLPECVEMATGMFANWMASNGTNQYDATERAFLISTLHPALFILK